MPWTSNDHVVWEHPHTGSVMHLDLQRGCLRQTGVHGKILACSTSMLVSCLDRKVALVGIPSFHQIGVLVVDDDPLQAFLYDLHIFVACAQSLWVCDQKLQVLGRTPYTHIGRAVMADFFVGSVNSRLRLGLVLLEAESKDLKTFIVEYQRNHSLGIIGKVDTGAGLLYCVPVLRQTNNLIACVYSSGKVIRIDPINLKIEQTGDLKTGIMAMADGHLVVQMDEKGLGLFDLNTLTMSRLLLTNFALSGGSSGGGGGRDVKVSKFSVCRAADYMLAIDDNGLDYKIYAVNGAVDASCFAKNLLSSASQSCLSVSDGWTLRLHISHDAQVLRSFVSHLILLTNESTKGSQVGSLCKILHFAAKYCPSLSCGAAAFDHLNELERVVRLVTPLTSRPDKVASAVDNVLTRGACMADCVEVFRIPDDTEGLLFIVASVTSNLRNLAKTTPRPLFTLAMFTRRAVTVIGFALALRDLLDKLCMASATLPARFFKEKRDELAGLIDRTCHLPDAIRSLYAGLFKARTQGNRLFEEHELAVSVVCMLLTNSEGPAADAISDMVASHISGATLDHPDSYLPDKVRCVPLKANCPVVSCRMCNGKTVRANDIYTVRWNEQYANRCPCGGEWT